MTASFSRVSKQVGPIMFWVFSRTIDAGAKIPDGETATDDTLAGGGVYAAAANERTK
jgi:hypothetical protein